MTTRKNGTKADQAVVNPVITPVIDPLDTIREMIRDYSDQDTSNISDVTVLLGILETAKTEKIERDRLVAAILEVNSNITIDDSHTIPELQELLKGLRIVKANRIECDRLIELIKQETTEQAILDVLPKMSVTELQDVLDKIKAVKLISKVKATEKVDFVDYQPGKSCDCMLIIQGQKTKEQLHDDPISCAIGSVLIKIGSLPAFHFAECFETSVILRSDAFDTGLSDKQIKSLHKDISEYWCLAEKRKKLDNKKSKQEEKNKARQEMREQMIKAIRDRK